MRFVFLIRLMRLRGGVFASRIIEGCIEMKLLRGAKSDVTHRARSNSLKLAAFIVISISVELIYSWRFHARATDAQILLSSPQPKTTDLDIETSSWTASTEAQHLSNLLFNLTARRYNLSVPVPHELQRPETKLVLVTMDEVWEAFRFSQKGLCQESKGLALIESLSEAVNALNSACNGNPNALPYTLIRRMAWSLLQVLHEADCQRSILPALIKTFSATFSATLNCSRHSRGILELLHVSKSGGTSVCQLAKEEGLYNPYSTLDHNCIVPNLDLDPKWTRRQEGEDPTRVWPAVDCPHWAQESEVSCSSRKASIKSAGIEFFAAEG